MPRLLIVHADMDRALAYMQAGDIAGFAAYLSELFAQLARGGAGLGVIPAVTPHACVPKLVLPAGVALVDMIEETARAIAARKLARVALFGTRFVIESGMFGRLTGVELVQPRPDETARIHDSYLTIARTGVAGEAEVSVLRDLAHTIVRREKLDAIVLAGTELALAFNDTNTDFPALDCARIHLDAILRRMME